MDRDARPTEPIVEGDGDEPATYGRFQARGVIGRGGMGVVLRAKDPELDRDVAIKLLKPGVGSIAPGGAFLQREAQAMAKLAHPNVVTVFETGLIGETRFIAMELVEGTTLRKWLAEERTWREITATFVACGRGLAAAHAAGLVHRDFKADNVLIGRDGRPRVSDFGLVDAQGSAGTPAYMAPEQASGEAVDARADQYAFCVSLREALGDRKVPGRIERAIERGTQRDRAARWLSMEALLRELDVGPRVRWELWIAAGAVVVGGSIALVMALRTNDPCPDPELAGVWDAAIEGKISAAFDTANPAIAKDTFARVSPALDDYAKRWRGAVRGACRATRVDGTQSQELLDRRVVCLERRRDELAAVTSALAVADHDRVATSIDAVGALGDVDHCANREMLLAQAPPDKAQRDKVTALETELRASRFEGKPKEREARAAAALAAARELGYLPTLVHALEEHYAAALDNTDDEAAEASVRELAKRASEAHDDALAAHAWTAAIILLARRNKLDEAKTLEAVAQAAVARAGSTPTQRYELAHAIGVRRNYAQELAGAVESLQTALAIAPSDLQRADTTRTLVQAIAMKDGPKAAIPVAEQGLVTMERAYGPKHPRTALTRGMLATLIVKTAGMDAARPYFVEALAGIEATIGKESIDYAQTEASFASQLIEAKRCDEAAPYIAHATAVLTPQSVPDLLEMAAKCKL